MAMHPTALSKADRLKLLLAEGFFPSQLPPCFTSHNLAEKYSKVVSRWDKLKPNRCVEDTECERYSVARVGHGRRPISIPNPVSQFYLSRFISNNWGNIYRHLQKSRISLSKPQFKRDIGRAISITAASEIAEQKLLRSAGARFALVTDISQFFPSLYTHAIPWALHGKSVSKDKRNRKNPKYYGNTLDELARACQNAQTIGIPIGPDTSHIISEILGVAIDLEIKKRLKKWPRGLRHVDDFYLFFDTEAEAVKGLASVTSSLQEFELRHNILKTRIIPVQLLNEDSWTHGIGAFEFSYDVAGQRKDIHRYFDLLFDAEKKNSDENVVLYGLRKLQTQIIKRPNWPIFQAYLFRCILQYPNTIQDVATIVATYIEHNFPVKNFRAQWANILNGLIQQYAHVEGHSEVAWLLWLSNLLDVRLAKESVGALEKIHSSVCILLGLHLEKRGLLQRKLKRSSLGDYRDSKALYKSSWLLTYEGARQGWLPEVASLVKNDQYFGPMLNEGIGFFSETGNVAPIFQLKREHDSISHPFNDEYFDDDEDISNYFDFSDIAENYLNSRRRSISHSRDDEDEERDNTVQIDISSLWDDIPL
ncbi:RNA-directed DNA polymerase [Rhodocyclus gracilis]|uniref:Reverse transcriptase domain-containing protein n=1 Tax=Rhodocyclus tenuis TaxID=1066 RepID=A0A6L5JUJ3_RHOTE|nr:RNA-directed DNA polymerase [Rhodocyclus gracilis]MQY50731.1 hypothetical protein [Rhodocyclus gracilis]